MTDIVERLRHWSHGLTYDPAAGLMHEAAAEIARLGLTDEEREAVELAVGAFVDLFVQHGHQSDREIAGTLRNLLERMQ